MSPEEKERKRFVLECFEHSLDLDGESIERFLEGLPVEIRKEVEALWAHSPLVSRDSSGSRQIQSLDDVYEIEKEIGRGGMGVVYRARQRRLNRVVALKLIKSDMLDGAPGPVRRKCLERFENEAEAAARLEHVNIVRVYDVGQVGGQHFYSMEFVDGQSLAEILGERGTLDPDKAAGYVEEVARGIHYAHKHGVLHRDIKPSNILVQSADREGDCGKITDFGIAKLLEGGRDVTRTGEVFGSPPYMSPEQAEETASTTVESDVYSLGATLYHALTGRPPFDGATKAGTLRRVREDDPESPHKLNPRVDRDIETICLKCSGGALFMTATTV